MTQKELKSISIKNICRKLEMFSDLAKLCSRLKQGFCTSNFIKIKVRPKRQYEF